MGQDLSLFAEALSSPWHTHRPSQLLVILTEEEAAAWPHPGLVGLLPWDANRGHYDPHLGRAVTGTSTESLTLGTWVAWRLALCSSWKVGFLVPIVSQLLTGQGFLCDFHKELQGLGV